MKAFSLGSAALTLGVWLALAASTHTQAAEYTVTDLGTLGGLTSGANAVNNAGQVVGTSRLPGDKSSHAVLFTSNGTAVNRIDLGSIGTANIFGGPYAYGFGLNLANQAVGASTIPNTTALHAVYYFVNGGTVNALDLGTLGGDTSQANAINGIGQIVGYSPPVPGNPGIHAALFTVSGSSVTRTDLGTLGGNQSAAFGINSAGQIAGYSNPTGSINFHATLFTVNGSSVSRTDLGTLGGTDSRAFAINDAGQIVGWSYFDPSEDSAYHATLFTVNGSSVSRTDLGTLGGSQSYAYAINNAGQIAGNAITASGVTHPFVYTVAGGMKDLSNLVGPNPAVSGLGLAQGATLNDWGQIAANGSINGASHALLLNPTSPAVTVSDTSLQGRLVVGTSYGKLPAFVSTAAGASFTALSLPDGMAGEGGNETYGLNRNVTITKVVNPSTAPIITDAMNLQGTANDRIVVQIAYNKGTAATMFGKEANGFLAWYNGTRWVNAVEGNTEGTPLFAGERSYNPATDFHPGTYGIDLADHHVWAVVNHGGLFSVALNPQVLRNIRFAIRTGTVTRVIVDTYAGYTFQLQRADAVGGPYANVGSAQSGPTGQTVTFINDDGAATQGFYRVLVGL